MKLLTIIGARPQFVKAAAVSRAIQKTAGIRELLVHTGQHYDHNMSDIFFEEMEIPKPHYNLGIHGLSHGAMTGQMLEAIEGVLQKEKPDAIMVYGDTNSTLAGALAAVKLHIPVAHIEAGLRSFNMRMPEEINRILTDRISRWLFCPTLTAMDNLHHEGFEHFDGQLILSGDVMQDAALFYAAKAESFSTIFQNIKARPHQYLLCTVHRAENTDDPKNLACIVQALNELNETIPVVLPLHPRTAKILEKNDLRLQAEIIPPVGYFDMIQLIRHCRLVLTDSGGLQKEAYFFDKFCVTLREQTEWTELVTHGYNQIAGTDKDKILAAVRQFLGQTFHKKTDLYGGGKAAEKIVGYLDK